MMAKEEARDEDEDVDDEDDDEKDDECNEERLHSADMGVEISDVSGRTATNGNEARDATNKAAKREMAAVATRLGDGGGGGSRN